MVATASDMIAAAQEETQHIVIRSDGRVRYERIRRNGNGDARPITTRDAPLHALFPSAAAPICYPPKCRFYVPGTGRTVVVLEEPPRPRTVTWNTQEERFKQMRKMLADAAVAQALGMPHRQLLQELERRTAFTLAFPYLVKVFLCEGEHITAGYCFYRTAPLRSHRDELCFANLPNVNGDGKVCWGPRFAHIAEAPTLLEQCTRADEVFWGSAWNQDYLEGFEEAARRIREVSSPWHWAAATAEDSTFVLRVPWRSGAGTVGEHITELLLDGGQNGAALFGNLVTRIECAAQDGAVIARGVEPSTDDRVVLADDLLDVGDRVTIASDVFGVLPDGGTFTVTRFSRDTGGMRVAQFAEIGEPLAIILDGALVEGVRRVDDAVPIAVAGVPVVRGTVVRVTEPARWPRLRPVQLVVSARQDGTGAVRVLFPGHALAMTIAVHDAVHAGLALEPPEAVGPDGRATATAVRIGQHEVRVGDRVAHVTAREGGAEELRMRTVAAFLPLQPRDCCRRAVDTDGKLLTLEDEVAPGRLHPAIGLVPDGGIRQLRCRGMAFTVGDIVLLEEHPATVAECAPFIGEEHRAFVRFGDTWVRVGTRDALAVRVRPLPRATVESDGAVCGVAGTSRTFAVGMYVVAGTPTIVDITAFAEDGPYGVTAHCVDGSAIPFIRQGMFAADWARVERSLAVGGTTLAVGAVIRSTRSIPRVMVEGEEFTVHAIEPSAGRWALPRIVCADGRAMLAIRENLILFAWKDGTAWRPFADDPDAYPKALAEGLPGKGIKRGVTVRYLGGDRHTAFQKQGSLQQALTTHATVISRDVVLPLHVAMFVWFHASFPGLWTYDSTSMTKQHIRPRCLARVGAPRLETSGFSRAFLDPMQVRVHDRGAFAGRDAHGTPVHVGDRVRVIQPLAGDETLAACEHAALGSEFVVAHSCHVNVGENWWYLASGHNLGTRRARRTVGFTDLPEELRDDRRWLAQLTFARSNQCVRIG